MFLAKTLCNRPRESRTCRIVTNNNSFVRGTLPLVTRETYVFRQQMVLLVGTNGTIGNSNGTNGFISINLAFLIFMCIF